MKKKACLLFLTMATLQLFAQPHKITRAWAFVTESVPGVSMVDDNGNTVDPTPIIERIIYLETSSKQAPIITTVKYGATNFTVSSITCVNEAKHNVGIDYKKGTPIFLTAKTGNKIWRLSTEPAMTKTVNAAPTINIIITGKLGKKIFKQLLKTETRLVGPEYN
jgi:hypothetical protein